MGQFPFVNYYPNPTISGGSPQDGPPPVFLAHPEHPCWPEKTTSISQRWGLKKKIYIFIYPPGNQHIPPGEKENHLQKWLFFGDMLVPRRVFLSDFGGRLSEKWSIYFFFKESGPISLSAWKTSICSDFVECIYETNPPPHFCTEKPWQMSKCTPPSFWQVVPISPKKVMMSENHHLRGPKLKTNSKKNGWFT